MICHTAQIWIKMTKRQGTNSENGFIFKFSYLDCSQYLEVTQKVIVNVNSNHLLNPDSCIFEHQNCPSKAQIVGFWCYKIDWIEKKKKVNNVKKGAMCLNYLQFLITFREQFLPTTFELFALYKGNRKVIPPVKICVQIIYTL